MAQWFRLEYRPLNFPLFANFYSAICIIGLISEFRACPGGYVALVSFGPFPHLERLNGENRSAEIWNIDLTCEFSACPLVSFGILTYSAGAPVSNSSEYFRNFPRSISSRVYFFNMGIISEIPA